MNGQGMNGQDSAVELADVERAVRQAAKNRDFPTPVDIHDSGTEDNDDLEPEYYVKFTIPNNTDETFGGRVSVMQDSDYQMASLVASTMLDSVQKVLWKEVTEGDPFASEDTSNPTPDADDE